MRNINIKDIAKLSGVGVSTVSRVINQHPDVKDETRKHVLEIIEAHNYIPNNSARNLKRLESNHVGILIKGMYNPFFAQMIEIIEKIMTKNGYTAVIHYNIDSVRDIDSAHEFIMEKKLKGIICLGGDFDRLKEEDLLRLGVPVIFTSTDIPESIDPLLYSSVGIDNESASFEAVDYICQLGHRAIGIISSGEGDKSIGLKRTRGYLRALEKNEIQKNELFFEVGDYSFKKGYEAMQRLLEKAPEITAVFSISDIMAIGAAKAIHERGLKIPEDISIVGFDDIDYAAYYNPALTTVHQPVDEIAGKTAETMVSLLDGDGEHGHIVFTTKLVERFSCTRREI